jgi:hypothetical protein
MNLIFNGIIIDSRESDNFINATKMCKAFNKKFNDWYRLNSTKELIKTLEKILISKSKNEESASLIVVDIKYGNSKKFKQGSWIHSDLAIQLAQWLSPLFAIQVSNWIRELYITGNVTLNSIKSDKEWQNKIQILEQENQASKSLLNRLHNINIELLTYKKLTERNESIYIISSYNYIKQGLFKVGRTKNIKNRISNYNSGRINGDRIKVLNEFKVNDSAIVEKTIHKKLNGLRPDKKSEFFLCPYDLLYDIVDLIIYNDNEESEAVDQVINNVFELKEKEYEYLDWTSGLDMSIFDSNMKLVECITDNNGEAKEIQYAEFDITTATKEQKNAFIKDCLLAYQTNILIPQNVSVVIWTCFKPFLIEMSNIKKKDFKALEWKDNFKEVAKEENIEFKLRK